MMQPIVAVVCDTREFDRYVWHAAPDTYLKALIDVAGVLPLLVPAFGDKIDFDGLLARVDGVLMTGSKTNVHPSYFGLAPSAEFEPYDLARDATSLPIIRAAVAAKMPFFAICRGIQEMNVALGGTLATEIQEQAGRMDHRAPEAPEADQRFVIRHGVNVTDKSCLAAFVGSGSIEVNSLHRQAINDLAPSLQIEASAPDGTIEAVSVDGAEGFALGVQWHPEYWAQNDTPSRALFEAFGDAVRTYHSSKART